MEQLATKTGIDVGLGASILALVTVGNIEVALQMLGLVVGITLGMARLWLLIKEIKERGNKRNRRLSDRNND